MVFKPYVGKHKDGSTWCHHSTGTACHGCALAVSGKEEITWSGVRVSRGKDGTTIVGGGETQYLGPSDF